MPADTDGSVVEQRIAEQAARLGDTGAVTSWASLRLAGGGFFDGLAADGKTQLPVPVIGKVRFTPGVTVSRERLTAKEVERRQHLRCTTVTRALFDEMRRTPDLRDAVVAMDMAAAAELTSIRRMTSYVDQRATWPRVRLVRLALDLANEHSRSPAETRTRLVLMLDACLPRPLCNRAVYSYDGQLLGVPDLLLIEVGVAVEYDGAHHRDRSRHRSDVAREDLFRAHGWSTSRSSPATSRPSSWLA